MTTRPARFGVPGRPSRCGQPVENPGRIPQKPSKETESGLASKHGCLIVAQAVFIDLEPRVGLIRRLSLPRSASTTFLRCRNGAFHLSVVGVRGALALILQLPNGLAAEMLQATYLRLVRAGNRAVLPGVRRQGGDRGDRRDQGAGGLPRRMLGRPPGGFPGLGRGT